ncbi:hypothetical protein M3Y95_00268200 [Aphelenchoides besseyi]|nr:hypothetical protein M3Y95_00268200 [Aphelenchoides besseyi]
MSGGPRAPTNKVLRQGISTSFLPRFPLPQTLKTPIRLYFRQSIDQPSKSVLNNIPLLRKRVHTAYRRREVSSALPKRVSTTIARRRPSHLRTILGQMIQEKPKKSNVQLYFGVHDIDTLLGHLHVPLTFKNHQKWPEDFVEESPNPTVNPKIKQVWSSKVERTFTKGSFLVCLKELDNSEIDCIWEVGTILLRKYVVVFPDHIDGVREFQCTGKRINWNPNDKTAFYELPNSADTKKTNQQVSIAIPTMEELQKIRTNKLLEHEMETQRETNDALNTIIELMDMNLVCDD